MTTHHISHGVVSTTAILTATVLIFSGCYDRMQGDSIVNTLDSPVVVRITTEGGNSLTNVVGAFIHFVWTSEQGRAAFRVSAIEVETEKGRKIGMVSVADDPRMREIFGKNLAFAVFPDVVCPIGKRFFDQFDPRSLRKGGFPDYFKRREKEIVEFYERHRRSTQ